MYELANMTWEEVAAAVKQGIQTAVLPIGATEQHGPHMVCGMDSAISDTLCKTVAEKAEVILLPTLPYGCSVGHSKRWPGTMALNPKTLIDVITDLGNWVQSSGIRRLVLVNGHVTNAAPLRCALEMLRARYDDLMIALVHTAQISERVKKAHHDDAEDWHANHAETALMMALHPGIVREDKLQEADDPDRTDGCVFSHPVNRTSKNGVTGKPSAATAADGEQLFTWMCDDLTALLNKAISEEPPLDQSYHHSILADSVFN
tara:strand:- start:504 stop:1286 length:783 start_codon:yes stop_codon:yes gene_type:complete